MIAFVKIQTYAVTQLRSYAVTPFFTILRNFAQHEMNFTASSNNLYTYHTVSNAEFSGVLDKYQIHGMYAYNETTLTQISFIYDYHIFIRYGNKVYMEVKGIGDIVMSFSELQKNKYWKHYYDLSLLLTTDKHSLIKDLEYNSNYHDPNIYEEIRFWSINTAFIDGSYEGKTKRVVENEYNCYYKINPFDLDNMNYASQKNLDIFKKNYMSRYEVRSRTFDKKSVYYDTFVLDYCISLMEKELDELSEIFEDKKNMVNLVALNDIEGMNGDVLRIIYNHLVGTEGKKIYTGIIDKIDNCKNKLERDVDILQA